MKKRKLFMAFEGTPAELRDCLIDYLSREKPLVPDAKLHDWNKGVADGRRMAYDEIIRFLKTLTINDHEHVETDNAAGQ